MADQRDGGIAWTDATWNPIRGCSRVSEGCRNCYAERVAARFSRRGQAYEGLASVKTVTRPATGGIRTTYHEPRWTGEVRFVESALDLPFHWKRPRRIFVNSMSDLFHEKVSDEWITAIFGVMLCARRHHFQILTKRPERMLKWLSGWTAGTEAYMRLVREFGNSEIRGRMNLPGNIAAALLPTRIEWPLPNVWAGVSVENQATRWRLDVLRQTPAAVRFCSLEPLLEDLGDDLDLSGIDQAIFGGESGPNARPCDLAWIRKGIARARAAGCAVFVKQLGGTPTGDWGGPCDLNVRETATCGWVYCLRDRKGGDTAEWPEDLRGVREWPRLLVLIALSLLPEFIMVIVLGIR